MKKKVVLYNPRSVFYTMPLALVALGSRLDPAQYDVRIVDARIEPDPHARVLQELDGAVCLGVTVLTGAPIRDALIASRAARTKSPALPIVWGGWHPSLFAEQCLQEPSVDVAVIGQGEETFLEIVERAANGESFDGVAGCVRRANVQPVHSAPAPLVTEPPRPLKDINQLPASNYDLIDVEKFFALKKTRQLDYISSQGCRFRCTFCADPYVYKRGWYGLEPERMGQELEHWWKKHHFTDIGFQDETFFTNRERVAAIANEFLRRNLHFTWMATMRADQGFRLDESLLNLSKRAGLRRVMIGVESGSQKMLDWMKKDIKLEHVFDSAEKCRRAGIGIIFNVIVGFPDEPPESIVESLRVAKQLRAMSPDFEVAFFYYKPYPGNEIADMLVRDGYQFPNTLDEWSDFDYVGSSGPWVTREKYNLVERFKFYQRLAWNRASPFRVPLQLLARWRCENDVYHLPIEKQLVEWFRQPLQLS